ncbi:MAG: YfiR family protein [Luteolibacter sp.]
MESTNHAGTNARPRSSPTIGMWSLAWWCVALLCAMIGAARADDSVSKEYQLKAAFLYNFTKFVEWPAVSFANADSPIVIGIFRSNPFGGELEKIVSGRKVNGRKIIVAQIPSPAAARQTQILFVGAAQDSKLNEVRGALNGAAVLTVGESEAFARQGGMVTFTLQYDSLRFSINNDSAQKAGLKISSQLQKLALKPGGGNP